MPSEEVFYHTVGESIVVNNSKCNSKLELIHPKQGSMEYIIHSAAITYSTMASAEGCMWLRTSALYSRLPSLGYVNWFVSYNPLICTTQGNIMIFP